MATPINNWPFTDLHNQNLDWVIQTVKDLQEEVREFTEDLPHVSAWNNGTWDITHAYDANEIVFDDNKMYLSVKPVPANTQISNTTYWTEIADMGFEDSVVKDGWLAGNTISELMETYIERVVGEDVYNYYGRQFPLLIKFLDIKGKLSVQVHPGEGECS